MAQKVVYKHDENLHHMGSPASFVPVLIELFHPTSVVDFGCGVGNFLEVFHQSGIRDILGVDGKWVDQKILAKHIDLAHFLTADLSTPINLERKFDLAISFEVAEHIPPASAETFVKSLTDASDVVVFSGAIPYQGGQNHLNEQWPEYWADLFARRGYERYDLIRPRIWQNEDIQVWYRQNTFVYVNKRADFKPEAHPFPLNSPAIHPEMYHYKAKSLEDIQRGTAPFGLYWKLMGKAILRRLGLLR